MRIEKEYIFNDVKSTLFYWNNKYLLKFERGDFEQTFKFSEFDYTKNEIEEMLKEDFINEVRHIFISMNKTLQKYS